MIRNRKVVGFLMTAFLVVLGGMLVTKVGHLLWSSESWIGHEQFVNSTALKSAMDHQQPMVILDIRPRSEYASGHIPSAKNIPADELEVRAPNELDQAERIVTYCRCIEDTRSDYARQSLISAGFKDVVYLEGGLLSWESKHYPLAQSTNNAQTRDVH